MPRFTFIRTSLVFGVFYLSVKDNHKNDSLHIEIDNSRLKVWSNMEERFLNEHPVDLVPFISLAAEMHKHNIITEPK